MKNLLLILLLVFAACTQKTTNCTCLQGIGSNEEDAPIEIFTFSNGKSVSVCGYEDGKLISEFNIFDCETGESLLEYGALKSCTLSFENDKLIITEVLNLPNNDLWEYENVPFAQETITTDGDKLKVAPKKALPITSNISEQVQNDFLNTIETTELKTADITEDLLLRLELLALAGNKRAETLLRNIGNSSALDGSIKETHNLLIEHIEFTQQNK